jgi:integrase
MVRGKGRRAQDSGAFGTASQLPSGRWRAMYYGPDGSRGRRYTAPTTFKTKREARRYLATVQTDIIRGKWLAPVEAQHRPQDTVASYAAQWIEQRDLKDKTAQHYRYLLAHYVTDTKLGGLPLPSVTADDVRAWYAKLDKDTPTLRAHCYSLLKTVMGSAVTDGRIAVSPCTIRGAASSRRVTHIRPATVDELVKLTEAMPPQYRLLTMLAGWCALRFGELTELRRKDIDLDEEGVIRVRRGVVRVNGDFKVTTPKSAAGQRDVHIPPHLLPLVREHLVEYVEPGGESLLFPAAGDGNNRHLAQSSLFRHYSKARAAAGRPDLALHHLRHTGAVLASLTGATLAELMDRLGHSSPRAALRYQHVAAGRDKAVAAALSELAENT